MSRSFIPALAVASLVVGCAAESDRDLPPYASDRGAFADGDPDLQDMFESPVEGIDWDEVGFLVYQILWSTADGQRLGPDLVHSYTRTAVERFGDRTAIALGTIGSTAKNTTLVGYAEPAELRVDEAAALAAGAPVVHLFSIDGMVVEGDVSGVGPVYGSKPPHPEATEQSLHRLTPPASSDGTWTFSTVAVSGGLTAQYVVDPGSGAFHHTRFFYVPALRVFAWIPKGTGPVELIRP